MGSSGSSLNIYRTHQKLSSAFGDSAAGIGFSLCVCLSLSRFIGSLFTIYFRKKFQKPNSGSNCSFGRSSTAAKNILVYGSEQNEFVVHFTSARYYAAKLSHYM